MTMATILIIDDRPINRDFLVQLLGYRGHRTLEAADGAEGLAVARTERPDLVIADVLMPTMDGYELVHRMRADPAIERIPVIFYSAHYLEREARDLARACGVSFIITKPSAPDVILRIVDAALDRRHQPAPPAPPAEVFDRDHIRLMTDKLSAKVEEQRRTNQRLNALIELCQQLASEREAGRMLDTFCRTAREIVGARYAVVGILREDGETLEHALTSGMDAATAAAVAALPPRSGVLGKVLAERSAQRLRVPYEHPEDAGLPAAHPQVRSVLAVPIVSLEKVYGWLCLGDKLGAAEFSEEDEALAVALAAQVGRIYENGRLYTAAQRYAAELEREIVERKLAEQALRESQRFVQRINDASPNIVYVYDLIDEIGIYANRQLCALLGHTPEELQSLGKDFFRRVMDPDDHAALVERYMPQFLAARDGDTVDIELHLKHVDGTWRWFHSRNVVFSRTPEGFPKQILGAAQDITERKRAADRMRELERRARQRERLADIGTITATLVHDLRNPLGNIALQAYMLLDEATHADAPAVQPLIEPAQRIVSEARRLEHLIDEFMNVSREQRLDRKPLDLRRFLREVVEPWYPAAEERLITLRLQSTNGVPALSADEEKLRRVLDNLIRNALEAIDAGPGSVEVALSVPEPDQVRISVRDTGPGVSPSAHIFRIFETTKPNGSGLGLALARQIVLAHGGTIRYENLQPRGAVFHLELPCADAAG
jgi:two-component system, cell cycle sensor histidine kinase and response regulator CckA